MKTLSHSFLLCTAFIVSVASAAAPVTDGWTLVHEESALKVFERDEAGSLIVAFRGEGKIKAPLYQVASVVLNHARSTEWVPQLKTNRIVRFLKPNHYLEYNQIRTPPLTKNRDFLFETTLDWDPKARQLSISSHSAEDSSIPKDEDFVRGNAERIIFTLKENDAGTETELRAEIKVDPRGSIPKWMVNLFQRSWPKKAFHGIVHEIEFQKFETPVVFQELIEKLKKRTVAHNET